MAIKRLYDTLVGATVAVNQLCNSSSVTVPNGHKYYMIKGDTASIGASTGTAITGLTSGTDIVIDLTAMFGSTIADYIYSLESATAGAGIAKLREWGFFTREYIPYNPGTLESVEARSHVTRGFNQWDEETESGYINPQTGVEIADSSKIRMKNFMPVLPNTTYYKKSPTTFWNIYFDADKNYIGYGNASVNQTFTTPNNCHYIRCGFESAYGTTYNHDICINLSSDRNGEYEPYHEYSYLLDSTVTLRGIPKLDSNNDLYYDGDTYASDGTHTIRYRQVKITNAYISGPFRNSYGIWCASILDSETDIVPSAKNPVTCDKLTCFPSSVTYSSIAGNGLVVPTNANFIAILGLDDATSGLNASSTTAQVMTAMANYLNTLQPTIVYELATPTTETADPFTNPQICDPDGTEEYVTSNGVPVGHETRYQL